MANKKNGMRPSHAQEILGRAGRANGASRFTESEVVIKLRSRSGDIHTYGCIPTGLDRITCG
jgi:hypothetical protein